MGSVDLREFYRVRGQGSTLIPTVSGVQSCPIPGGQSVNTRGSERASCVAVTVGVQLGASHLNVGADPHGLAGLEIGCDVEQHGVCVVWYERILQAGGVSPDR